MVKKVECLICVRDHTSDIDGLCNHCRSHQIVNTAHAKLQKFMSDEQIDALVEFLDAKTADERFF